MADTNAQRETDSTPAADVQDRTEVAETTWLQSVRATLRNKNFTIFLITSWIYSSVQVVNRYFNLYFRDLGLTYVLIGVLTSGVGVVVLVGEFVSGYLADNHDRKKLASVTMAINGVGYFLFVFAFDIWSIAIAWLMFALSSFTGKGGTAYIMEQIDRRHGGVAISLFTLGTVFGLVPLFALGVLLNIGQTFVTVMRIMFFVSGVAYIVCAAIRIVWLDPTSGQKRPDRSKNIVRDFLRENVRGLKTLVKVFPVFIAVLSLDALSDTLYGFSSLYYVNETLSFGIADINLMMLLTLTISIPLTLLLGRFFDKHGGRRLTTVVYSVMPVAMVLLILAQSVPYVAPPEWITAADSIYAGLSVIFSLAFIATAVKSINDVLWFSVINTYIQKSLPRQDLGKMLSLATVVVLLFVTVGPIPAGVIYELYRGIPLLYMALVLNVVILIVLVRKSIEPRVSVQELEASAKAVP